jgi:hypothetical protein
MVWDEAAKLDFPMKGHLMARKKNAEMRVVGGTCLTICCDDNETFIVGSESGSMFKCKISIAD